MAKETPAGQKVLAKRQQNSGHFSTQSAKVFEKWFEILGEKQFKGEIHAAVHCTLQCSPRTTVQLRN